MYKCFFVLFNCKIIQSFLHYYSNIIIIDKNVNLGGSADREVLWGNNSKKIYFFKSNGDVDKNGNYVSSENYINVITWK
ncbi:hypothetical protein Z954_01070 [Clostridium botulinum C/D str. BKT2873]|nr:hypothetical protein Z952_06125 [Clostridium botulinum C/D str. BKT75002]KEI08578.1 hypothetical protein Z954_01070 [Clostridium botulinum C/D str. BKT2873]